MNKTEKTPTLFGRVGVGLKICGMKHNVAEVATLQPDYLGFIFYEKSPRFVDCEEIPELQPKVKKIGVFVDSTLKEILEKVEEYNLEAIQLHGNESVNFCEQLKAKCQAELVEASKIEIWKVFSIKNEFDFEVLNPYENIIDKFIFDTKGKEKGGNGYTFDWEILKKLPFEKTIHFKWWNWFGRN